MRCLLVAAFFLVLAPAFAGASAPRLAYIKHGWLYTLRVDRSGLPLAGTKASRICRLWPVFSKGEELDVLSSSVRLVGSPDGRYIAVEHSVDTTSDQTAFGLPFNQRLERLWLVSAKPGSAPWEVADGDDPSFSPSGKQLAFDTTEDPGWPGSAIEIYTVRNHRIRILRQRVGEPFWSTNGKEIAADLWVAKKPGYGLILSAATGKALFHTEPFHGANPTLPMISPNGRYFSIRPEISRPILDTSTAIYDLSLGKYISRDYGKKQYVTDILEAWSPNAQWMLWQWLVPDPDNDGAALWEDVGLTSLDAHMKCTIGRGEDACFTPDSRHVFWLRTTPDQDWRNPKYDLMCSPFQGRAKRLVASVSNYSLLGAGFQTRFLPF